MAAKPTKKLAAAVDEAAETVSNGADKTATPFFRTYDDLAALGQGHFEAVVAANNALAKGAEELSKEIFGIAQASFEQAAVAAKAFFGAKTLQDVIALNNHYTKSTVDSLLANSAKLSEVALKVANEAAQPITARVNVTIEKLAKPIAA